MLTNSDETSTPASAQPASTEAAVASAAGTGAGSNVPSSAGEVAPVVLDVAASSSVATSSSVVIEPASDDKTGAQPAVATAGSGALTSVSAPSPVVAPEVHAESMEKARDAYKKGDLAASAAAHEAKRGIKAATENHGGTGSEYIKSIVFGGIGEL